MVPQEVLFTDCDKYTLTMKILDFYRSMTDSSFKKIRKVSLPQS